MANQLPREPLWPADWQSFSSFSGGPLDNVFLFTRAVHRFAYAHNRLGDNAWMAGYAYGCLVDEALYWFEGLDPGIQQDWSKLKPAIITKFGRNTPAPTTSRSRVKAVRRNGTTLGYIGPLTRGTTNQGVVTKVEEALVLDIVGEWDTQHHIRLAVPNESYPFLGLEEYTTGYWDFRACNAGEYPFSDRGSLMP
ncbi:hypothetical protein FRB94_014683 [Tulasnella sp. JGI-2019a]|nr:hypothetical protein FRB94_014683 [Tulasnella sp. JGI-2019a]